MVNTVFYGKSPSLAKWLILPIIVGGVAISTLKPNATGGYSIEYDLTALVAGSIGNIFAAFKGSENHKAMEKPGLKVRENPCSTHSVCPPHATPPAPSLRNIHTQPTLGPSRA